LNFKRRIKMKYKYIRITLNTVEAISKAERLLEHGWKIISSGFDTILLEKGY